MNGVISKPNVNIIKTELKSVNNEKKSIKPIPNCQVLKFDELASKPNLKLFPNPGRPKQNVAKQNFTTQYVQINSTTFVSCRQ